MISLSISERQSLCIAGVDRANHTSGIPSTFTFLRDGERIVRDGAGKMDDGSGAPRTW